MIIGGGHPDAVSFNDVGSPDGRHTSGLKVHINAQVVRLEDLNLHAFDKGDEQQMRVLEESSWKAN
jgi:hypothetical protein